MGRPIDKSLFGNTSNAGQQIQVTAYLSAADGGSSAVSGYIVKQTGSKRFKITTAQGTGVCTMVVSAPAAGEFRLTLQDSSAGTYYASKITQHKVTVTQGTGTQFATGASVPWVISPDSAVVNSSVIITSA